MERSPWYSELWRLWTVGLVAILIQGCAGADILAPEGVTGPGEELVVTGTYPGGVPDFFQIGFKEEGAGPSTPDRIFTVWKDDLYRVVDGHLTSAELSDFEVGSRIRMWRAYLDRSSEIRAEAVVLLGSSLFWMGEMAVK